MLTGQQPPTRWKVRLNDNKPFTTLWELCWTDSAWDHGVFGDHIPDAALLTDTERSVGLLRAVCRGRGG
jgi:hypothetical protein